MNYEVARNIHPSQKSWHLYDKEVTGDIGLDSVFVLGIRRLSSPLLAIGGR